MGSVLLNTKNERRAGPLTTYIYNTLFFFECKELFDFSIINYREIESGIILCIYFHKNIFYFLS